jgi:hypothetical protein
MKRSASRGVGVLSVILLAGLASCGGSGAPGAGAAAPRPVRNVLTVVDLARTGSSDLYSAVQRLRPEWLVVRGGVDLQGQQAAIAIIMDGLRQNGSVELMRNIPVTDVQEVRFLNARDATTKYGTNMTVGAIEITLKH